MPKEHYEDFMVPKKTTNVILRTKKFKEVNPEYTMKPTFVGEDLISEISGDMDDEDKMDEMEGESETDESGLEI